MIRFTDGSTAHTDLIRLNPNVDAYSLDYTGSSPRQLSHYREVPAAHAPTLRSPGVPGAAARVLAAGYPHLSLMELTARLRGVGHPLGHGSIREHEAIAATQAAIWHLTNGLELDTRRLDEPLRVVTRIGEHPAARALTAGRDGIDWHALLPAGETVYLELTLTGAPQVQAFGFQVGARIGRHPIEVQLEVSRDGQQWQPVSSSTVRLGDRRPGWRTVRRQLGAASTLSSASPAGIQGYPFYRLAARGPEDRDGLLDLHGVRLELLGATRFVNNERVVALYELLLADARLATGTDHRLRPLIGSRTPDGPAVFTPVVTFSGPPPLRSVGSPLMPSRPGRPAAAPSRFSRITTPQGAFHGR